MSLPLDKMTTSDKLPAMEELWDGLCRDPDSIPSPDWHMNILATREQKITEGTATFHTLHAAKKRIRDQIE